MIYCLNYSGQFGNQLLVLNNIIQFGIFLNINYNINKFKFLQFFNIIKCTLKDDNFKQTLHINSRDLIDIFNLKKKYSKNDLIKISKESNILLQQPCLGELYFEFHTVNINNYIQIKKEFQIIPDPNFINIALHFREMPKDWSCTHNGNDYLSEEYYINSINICINEYINKQIHKPLKIIIFAAFSDSQFSNNEKSYILNYKPFIKTLEYLDNNNILYEYCYTKKNNNDNFIFDFSQMSNCDILISSISTFSICAGIFGKSKLIIHSNKWIQYSINRKDKFWVDLVNNKSNDTYKIWKLC
jgi:hypothetical protein